MSFQELPTTPHNVEFLLSVLGYELTGCQIGKLIHLHTTRERSIFRPREFQVSNLVDNKEKSQVPPSVNTNKVSCVLPRVRCATRDTDAFQLTRFYIEHFRQ